MICTNLKNAKVGDTIIGAFSAEGKPVSLHTILRVEANGRIVVDIYNNHIEKTFTNRGTVVKQTTSDSHMNFVMRPFAPGETLDGVKSTITTQWWRQ